MEKEKCRLMVVDDEPIVGRRLKQIFEKAGYTIDTFTDGELALNELQKKSYDIIVTDLKMPGVDGMKILETARAMNPNLEVIIITAFAGMETAKEAFKKGVFDFISKPVQIDVLKQVIINAENKIRLIKS